MNDKIVRGPLFLTFLGLALVHCATNLGGVPRMADSEAGRCQTGLDMFERQRCDNMTATPTELPTVRAELARMKMQCTDAESQARMPKLDACVERYRSATQTARSEHDEIRKKYAKETAAVQADPAYRPLLDKWALARDEAQIAENDWTQKAQKRTSSPYYRVYESKQKALEGVNAEMRALLAKHNVDPKYSTVLGLW